MNTLCNQFKHVLLVVIHWTTLEKAEEEMQLCTVVENYAP